MKANVTTSSSAAIELPAKRRALLIQNESDTAIRIAFGKAADADSIVLPATTGSLTLFDPNFFEKGLMIYAIHAGSGTKQLTYDTF